MHKKRSDMDLGSSHVDLHNEQAAMPDMGSAVPGHKLKVKTVGMSSSKAAAYKADVLPPAHQRGQSSGITSMTQSFPHDRKGGKSTS